MDLPIPVSAHMVITVHSNRPGTLLQVLCRRENLAPVARCILAESTTLGVRYHAAERFVASARRFVDASTFGIGTRGVLFGHGC